MKTKHILLVIFSIALFKAISFSLFGFGLVDEGESLHNALRILQGDIPYRDFFAIFPPLDNYIYAIILAIFGKSIVIPRIVESIVFSFFPPLLYLVSYKLISKRWAIFISIYSIFVELNSDRLFFFTPIFLSIWLITSRKNKLTQKVLFISGAMLGLVAMVRVDLPAVYIISLSFGLTMYLYYTKRKWLTKAIRSCIVFGLALLIAPVCFILWSIYHGISFNTLWTSLVTKSVYITHLHDLPTPTVLGIIPRSLSISDLWTSYTVFIFYLLISTYVFVGIYVVSNWKKIWKKTPEIGIFLFAGVMALPYVLGRTEMGHIIKGGIPFLILAPFALNVLMKKKKMQHLFVMLAIVLLLGGQLMLSAWWLSFNDKVIKIGNDWLRINSTYKLRTTVVSADTLKKSVEFIQHNSEPGDSVLIMPYMAGLYYLSNRFSATEYNNVLAGFVSSQEEQEFIEKIEKANIRVVVYDPNNGPAMKKNRLKDYNPLVDKYIMSNFQTVDKTREGWLFMLAK